MKLQLAARDIVLLLLVMYLSLGVAVYLIDIAQDWCNLEFSLDGLFWRSLLWPPRLFYGNAYCD